MNYSKHARFGIIVLAAGCLWGATFPAGAADQDHEAHHAQDSSSPPDPHGPLAPLAQALDQNHGTTQSKSQVKKMKMSPSQGTTPAMSMPAAGGGMSGGMMGMGPSGGVMKAMEPMMASMMGSMGQGPEQSSGPGAASDLTVPERPGIPGASHIFHVGATGFFLDHQDVVPLSQEQQQSLNQIKVNSLFDQSSRDRKIAQAEQELWSLTSADTPNIKAVDRKVKEIETLKGDERIAFIRSINEAAKLLRPDQRAVILGRASPQNSMGSMGAGAPPPQPMGSPPTPTGMPAGNASNAKGMAGGAMKMDQGEMGGMPPPPGSPMGAAPMGGTSPSPSQPTKSGSMGDM